MKGAQQFHIPESVIQRIVIIVISKLPVFTSSWKCRLFITSLNKTDSTQSAYGCGQF